MAGFPSSRKVELELTPGTWTDVSTYTRLPSGVAARRGRTNPYEQCSAGAASLVLDNVDAAGVSGYFTPGSALLSDSTANPFYPNVQENRRVRWTITHAAVDYRLFTGYVDSLDMDFEDGLATWNRVQVSATDVFKVLARRKLRTTTEEIARSAGAFAYYPMSVGDADSVPGLVTDSIRPDGAATVVQPAFNPAATQAYSNDSKPQQLPGSLTFSGWVSDSVGQGAGVLAIPATYNPDAYVISVGGWFKVADLGTGSAVLFTGPNRCSVSVGSGTEYLAAAVGSGAVLANNLTAMDDDRWHHFLAVFTKFATTHTVDLYVDGEAEGSDTGTVPAVYDDTDTFLVNGDMWVAFGGTHPAPAAKAYNSRNVSYSGLVLAAADLGPYAADLYNAGHNNISGETVAARATRILTWCGVAPADYSIAADTSATIGAQDIDGKSALEALQDLATAEGAPLFVNGAGQVVLQSRAHRSTLTPVATFDAAADLDGSGVAISLADEGVVNQVTATVSGGPSVTVYPTALMGEYMTEALSASPLSPVEDTIDAPWETLDQARDAAYQRLAERTQARLRFPQVTIDPLTAGSDIWVKTLALEIGDLIRVTGLNPATCGGRSQVDLFIEGIAWDMTESSITCTLDTTAVDWSIAEARFDDTDTGRFTSDPGAESLSSSLTSSGTSVAVATSSGPTLTTTGGAYPLTWRTEEEQIQLNNAPGGASSPQTSTGATRARNGSVAAAHASGTSGDLWPVPVFAQ